MAKRRKTRSQFTSKSNSARRIPHQRRLTLELLEDRRLLAITVNTLVDEADGSIVDGDISLRDAIAASPAGGTINFSVAGTINLALGAVVVQDRIIQGPGAAQLTINAHGASNVFTTRGTTTLSGLTITGGNSVRGGGIRNESVSGNEGHLTVASSVITGNAALLQGGGIHAGGYVGVYGSVAVVNSTVSGNQTSGSNNQYGQGGGIYTGYADVTVDKSTISGNSAGRFGGGIYGGVTMTNSTVSGNSAGGNASNYFSPGGGLFLRGQLSTISNSTISGNTGTGIRFADGGGGVVANSTVTANGFGIAAYGGAALLNTIVAGNDFDITGTVDVSGSRNNLIGSPSNPDAALSGIGGPPAGGLTNGVNGNIVGVADAGLGPLANNGGPTQTHALFSFSRAVNAGDNSLIPINPSTGLPFTVDQTGAARIFGGGTVDMGAVEVQGAFVPSTIVNTATDDVAANGLTSLREAIGFARILGGPVTFNPTVFATPQTISLVHGQITVDGTSAPLVINGPGAALATVDGADGPVVFKTYGTTTLSGLTITGAKFTGPPTGNDRKDVGAIENKGTLTISNSAVSNNQTRGIFNSSADLLNVVDSIISGNSADFGAGIFTNDSVLPRTISISNSVISGNTATDRGGGIYSRGTVTIANSTISGNSAANGGGIFNYVGEASTLSIVSTYIHHNTATGGGGGIMSLAGGTINNSTIASNTAGFGGGINGGTFTIVNTTISGNTANTGAGIKGGQDTIISSTIANNTALTADAGGGLDTVDASTLIHTIIAGNTAANMPSDVFSTTFKPASAYNLIGDAATAGGLVNGASGNIVGVNPALVFAPLADNGGPTLPGGVKLPTHALLVGSPAIDAGQPGVVEGIGNIPVFDERGTGFHRIVGNAIDIGAFERQTPELTGDYNRNDKVDAGDYVLWRKLLGAQFLPPYIAADGDGNGAIQPADYTVWRSHFGQSLPGAGTAQSNAGQMVAATIADAATNSTNDAANLAATVEERQGGAASIAKPAVGSPFVSVADTEGSPRIRARKVAAPTSEDANSLQFDSALLALLTSFRLEEGSSTEVASSHWHTPDDATLVDGSEVNATDVIFADLASARFMDL